MRKTLLFAAGLCFCTLAHCALAHTEADIWFIMPTSQELQTVAASTRWQSKSFDTNKNCHSFDRRWDATSQSRSVPSHRHRQIGRHQRLLT